MAKKNKVVFNKLVRDRIPEAIAQTGSTVVFRSLKGDELKIELKRKLLEEVNELVVAGTKEQVIEEMADIMEVIDQMQVSLFDSIISDSDIENARKHKITTKGGLTKGYYLVEMEG